MSRFFWLVTRSSACSDQSLNLAQEFIAARQRTVFDQQPSDVFAGAGCRQFVEACVC